MSSPFSSVSHRALQTAIRDKKWDETRRILNQSTKTTRSSSSRAAKEVKDDTNGSDDLIQSVNNWGQNALHYACCCPDTPIEILRLLLTIRPAHATRTTLLQRDKHGQIPLNYAIQNANHPDDDDDDGGDDKIAILIDACPSSAGVVDPVAGWTPLHVAIHFAKSPAVIRKLLVAAPFSVMTSSHGVGGTGGATPLEMFFEEWNTGVRMALLDAGRRRPRRRGVANNAAAAHEGDEDEDGGGASPVEDIGESVAAWHYLGHLRKLRDVEEVTRHLLRADLQGMILDDEPLLPPFEAINAAIRNKDCPWAFYDMMMTLHPAAARECGGAGGDYLLHAAAATRESNVDGSLYKCDGCERRITTHWHQNVDVQGVWRYCSVCLEEVIGDDTAGETAGDYVTIISVDKIPSVIDDLLERNPAVAGIPNGDGRLPLHLAIESGKLFHSETSMYGPMAPDVEGGLEAIFAADPRALATRDIPTHLYPFMMAAAASESGCHKLLDFSNAGDRLGVFSTCFALLIENPALIEVD